MPGAGPLIARRIIEGEAVLGGVGLCVSSSRSRMGVMSKAASFREASSTFAVRVMVSYQS
jgi:hypothetical protein